MLGQNEVIGMIESFLKDRGLQPLQATYGGWKLGNRIHLACNGEELQVWEEGKEGKEGYTRLGSPLRLPAHP